jgi:hypothetical protein
MTFGCKYAREGVSRSSPVNSRGSIEGCQEPSGQEEAGTTEVRLWTACLFEIWDRTNNDDMLLLQIHFNLRHKCYT